MARRLRADQWAHRVTAWDAAGARMRELAKQQVDLAAGQAFLEVAQECADRALAAMLRVRQLQEAVSGPA